MKNWQTINSKNKKVCLVPWVEDKRSISIGALTFVRNSVMKVVGKR